MRLRRQWKDTAQRNHLIELGGDVIYLRADVAEGLGFSGSELRLALGELAYELADSF